MSNPQITVTTTPPNQVQVLDGSIAVSIPASVSSINGLIGNVSLSGNTGVIVQSVANTISIGLTNVVSSISNLKGVVGLSGDSNINIQTSGNTVTFGLANVAKTNIGQTFTGTQTFLNNVILSGISASSTIKVVGTDNISIGSSSNLSLNTSSVGQNIAIGIKSLESSIGGNNNIGVGTQSLIGLTLGSFNIAIGQNAGKKFGTDSEGSTLDRSNRSIFLGRNTRALTTATSNEIVIGDESIGLGTNTTVIGNDLTTKTKLQGILELDDGVQSLNVKNKVIRIEQPQTIVDPFVEGAPGVMCWDDNNIYIKTNQGWKQLALTPVTGNLTGITFDFRLLPLDSTNYLRFFRGSSASYLDINGMTFVQENIPRVAYYLSSDGSEGELAGLLVERGSTNQLPSLETYNPSDPFSPWSGTNITVNSGSEYGTNVFGEYNVKKLTPSGAGVVRHFLSTDSIAGSSGQSHNISLFAKNYQYDPSNPLYLVISVDNNNVLASFDLQNNVYSIESGNYANPQPIAKITNYSNDWKKIDVTWTYKGIAIGNPGIGLYLSAFEPGTGRALQQYTATRFANTGILVTDIQFEENFQSSSYIKTVGSSVTRSPDKLFMDGVSFSSWFSATSGTFLTLVDNSLQENTTHTKGNVLTLFSINYELGNTRGFSVDRVMGSCGFRFITNNGGISYNFGSNINLDSVKNTIIALSYFNLNDSIMGVCASINGNNTEGITIDRTQFGICGASFFSIGYRGISSGHVGTAYYNGIIKKITYLNGAALDLKSLSTYQG